MRPFLVLLFVVPLLVAALFGIAARQVKPSHTRMFLWLGAISAAAFPVSVVLHNAVEALFGFEEPVFFLLAIFGSPLGAGTALAGAAISAIVSRRTAGQA